MTATTHDQQQVITNTRRWLRELVVGLRLCPFANAPLQRDSIRYTVCDAGDSDALYGALLDEFDSFLRQPVTSAETALFIVPAGLDDFDDYLALLHAAEAAIDAIGLGGTLQLASFHPHYRFADSDPDDAANYSNRSPYPMFHLLREELMEDALAGFPHPEDIPQQNIDRLRQLGLEEMQRRLQQCRPDLPTKNGNP